MNKATNPSPHLVLRSRAEAHFKQLHPEGSPERNEVESKRLVHELQVHQIELEMQNAELIEAREKSEDLYKTYMDLYDFAPVGYFSLNEKGQILETNLTGSRFLGVERMLLSNIPFQRFISPSSQTTCRDFLKTVFHSSDKQICEVLLRNQRGDSFWADLQAQVAPNLRGNSRWCRVSMSDLSTLKQAEETRQRLLILATANEKLNQEISRRESVEVALKESEGHLARLLKTSQLMEGQLRQLSRQLLTALEEERKRISRDLHDDVIQVLVGINLHLTSLGRKAKTTIALGKQIIRTQRLVEKGIKTVHQFARELRPDMLDDLGLVPTVESMLKLFTKRTKIHIDFFASPAVEQVNNVKQMVLYRITQSALSNIRRHAEASQVKVAIRELPGFLRLEIHDNGKSFKVAKMLSSKSKRLGLIGSRERVEMVGGRFELISKPGFGTLVSAEIPMDS